MKKYSVFLFSAVLLFGLMPPREGWVAEEVIGKECRDCHEDRVDSFQKDAHARYARHGSSQIQKGCQDCHGPIEPHMDDSKNINNPNKMSKESVDAICLSCHQKDKQRLHWKGSTHDFNDVACKDCHSMHNGKGTAKIKAQDETELCLNCHKKLRHELRLRSRHPIKEGKLKCSDCHNPHGSETEKMIDGANVNAKCMSCHTDKKGPFVFEHSPVREDCMTCHKPHGSNNDSLLVVKETTLCHRCHIHGRHQSHTGAEGDPWVYNRGCVNCHSNVHGSNHPSGNLFLR